MQKRKVTYSGRPIKHGSSWRIRWVDEHGKRRSTVYDIYDDAEFALKRHHLNLEEVQRGLRSPSAQQKKFNELCDYYLRYITPEKRRSRDDISIIGKHLRPFFGRLPLGEVEYHIDYFRASEDRIKISKKTLHNILTLLISMLNVAYDKRWILEKPRIKKPRLIENEYRYLKTNSEITKFLLVAKESHEVAHFLYSMAIYTGMRQGELAGLKWKYVDIERRLIHVCHSYVGPTKSGKSRVVPIVDAILPLLNQWKLKSSGDFVFTNAHGAMIKESSRVFQEVLHKILVKADFPCVQIGAIEKRYITFHDLRHTFASHWVMNSGDLYKLQKILGHQSVTTTMRYAHLTPDAFTTDLGIFSETTEPSGELLTLRQ